MIEQMLTMTDDKIDNSFWLEIIASCNYNTSMENLHNVDLIFFPIVRRKHFYVVFNLKKPEYIIMDNVAVDQEFKERYGILPERLRDFLVSFLKRTKHPKVNSIQRLNPKRWSLKCRTTTNGVDCGVFAIRHMETYMGETLAKYNAGLDVESPTQKMQLLGLRIKYLTKILLSDINLKKNKVLAEAGEFAKKSDDERRRLKEVAYETTKERLTA